MDLTTTYLGLRLPHPFLAGASPLADAVDRVRRLEDAGAAAIVLRSLFEEQLDTEAMAHHFASELHAESHGEAQTYLPDPQECIFGPEQYVEHLQAVKQAVRVPVIASLNGYTLGGWLRYARQLEDAGADALELNVYAVATDPAESSDEIEEAAVEMVREVKRTVQLPVAVKLSPFYTALPHFAARLREAGADGLVLFNRFFETDIDVDELEVRSRLELSSRGELLLRLRWLSILSAAVPCSYAVSGGVHEEIDAVKAILCGADVVQMVSALLRHGPGRLAAVRDRFAAWATERGYTSLQQMRGSMNLSRTPDPKALERGNYMRVLQAYRID